jgi:hypothetical protein
MSGQIAAPGLIVRYMDLLQRLHSRCKVWMEAQNPFTSAPVMQERGVVVGYKAIG